jgi:hypothetical protein
MFVWGTVWGKFTVQLSVVWFVLVSVSVNECTAQLADSMEIVSVGTTWLGSCSPVPCSVCVTSPLSAQHNTTVVQLHSHFAPSVSLPHCQHNTTPLLFSCTVNLPPLCHFPTVSTAQQHCCSAAQSLCPLCITSPLSAQCNATVVQLHSHFPPSVSLPHCQHSATPLLFSCTVTLPPLYTKLCTVNFLFYCDQTVRQQRGGGERIEIIQMVYWLRRLV